MVAIGVVEPSAITKWAEENKVEFTDMNEVLKNEKLEKAVIADFNRLAAENKFNSLEKIKHIYLTKELFSIENDILTPTMKIKRNVAKKVYENEIKELYSRPIAGAN